MRERDGAARVGVEQNNREVAKWPRPQNGSIEKGRIEVPVEVS